MDDQNALFSQYETEYCNNSTEIARNLQVISTLSPGNITLMPLQLCVCCAERAHAVLLNLGFNSCCWQSQTSAVGSCGKQRQR